MFEKEIDSKYVKQISNVYKHTKYVKTCPLARVRDFIGIVSVIKKKTLKLIMN